MRKFSTFFIVVASISPLLAEKDTKAPKASDQPHAIYSVHDKNRPHPHVVENKGAVSITPPKDAIVLFDGSSLDSWVSKSGGKPDFKVIDGVLVANGSDIVTKQKFGDCQLHFEWRVPKDRKVNGQKGGNSGCFLMNRYEIQVLQSHNNEVYADGQAGALYGQTPPLVNATTKQGDWQSYDIIFRAPRYIDGEVVEPATITALHNGVLLHHAKAYEGPTRHRTRTKYPVTHPLKDVIRLQWHNDPIEFRNIWIREVGGYDEPE